MPAEPDGELQTAMYPQTCPEQRILEQLLLGRLAPPEAAELERHLGGCATCSEALHALNTHDELVEALRGAKPLTGVDPEVSAILDRMHNSMFASEGADSAANACSVPEGSPTSGDSQLTMLREYRLLAKLGEGGMGSVYKAEHTKLKRFVALKSLPSHRRQSPDAIARFEREMWAVGALDHPNIVRAFDAGEHNGRHYLVMEFVNGVDVGLLVSHCGCLSIPDACEIIRQAAVGLAHAHQAGLVHRDIKPSNLMLTETGVVKILDLGLALANQELYVQKDLTTTGAVIGTIDYMAPEQAESTHEVDIRADIYSLGATLYRLLSGAAPFSGRNYDTLVKKVRALAMHVPESISHVRPDAPPELVAIIDKMLAKDPAARYSSPSEVAEALAPFCQTADLTVLTQRKGSPEESTWDRVDSDALSTMRAVPKYSERKPRTPDSLPQSSSKAESGSPQVASAKSSIPFWLSMAGVGGLLVAILSVVIILQTPKGQIEIQINDPEIKVAVENDNAIFQGVDKTHNISVTPGIHGLKITRGNFSFDTDKFVLQNGDRIRLQVTYLPGKLQVTSSDGAFEWSADVSGWRPLFDGKTFTGWNGIEKKAIPVGWAVVDGAIVGPGNATCIGTEEEFGDFELEFDWFVVDGANGGVFYRWDGGFAKTTQLLVFAPEYQIIDNKTNLDGQTAELSCASVFGLYPPSHDVTRPTPQWNTGRIVVRGNNVEHWVNGERVLTYDLKSDDWNSRIAKQQHLQPEQEFGGLKKGRIALQSFNLEIRYRNLRVRPLPATLAGIPAK